MTHDDIIKLAREAGLTERNRHSEIVVRHSNGSWVDVEQVLTRFARLVSAAEREACASLADCAAAESHSTYEHCISVRDPNSGLVAAGARDQAKKLSEAIRAKGQQ